MQAQIISRVGKEMLGNSAEKAPLLEPLRKLTGIGSLIDGASNLAKQLYKKPVSNHFIAIAEAEEGLDPAKVKNVVENQNFQGINTRSPEYLKYLTVVSIKEQVAREAIREVVRGENGLNLTQTEKIVLLANCDLADEFDGFNIEFQNDIQSNPFYKKLESMDPKAAKKLLEEKGVLDGKKQYLYVNLVEHENGSIEMVPYSAAYKDRVDAIAGIMEHMIEELDQVKGDPEAKVFAEYYQAYQTALTSPDVDQHEGLWQDLDKKWLKIKGRMQPIHMMESYSDSTGLRVEPDFALQFLDERERHITNMANETKEKMTAVLSDIFGESETLVQSVPSMKASIVGAFTTLIGGRRLDFRPAGQNLPNRPEVRKDGVKIFIDMETMRQRWEDSKELLYKVFGQSYVDDNFKPEEILPVSAGVRVAGHEVGHNAFIVEDTRTKMGADIYQDVEEHKADMSIITTVPEFLSPEEQRLFLKGLFTADLRILAIKNIDPSRKPYVNSALVSINAMHEAGILELQDGQWTFNLDPNKVEKFFTKMKTLMGSGLVPAYNGKSEEKGQRYIESMFVESDITRALEKTILG